MGGRGAGKTQNPTNDAGDADAGDGEEDEALQVALHDSILTHQQHSSDTSGLSDVPKQEQIEMLNAQLLSFLRVDVDVPNHGDCLFDTLVHVWNVEVSENAPEAPWIVSARERGLSKEAIQQAPSYQLLRDAMVDDMQAQLQKRTEEAATFTTDEAAKYRKQGVYQ